MAKATAATPTRGRSVSRGPASTKKPASPASSKDARRSSSKSQAAPVRKASKSPAVRARSVAKTTKPISNVSPTKRTKKTGLTNPVTEHFEFSGPYLGPLGIVFGLPILVWMFSVYCGQSGWPAFPTSVPSWDSAVSTVKAAVPTWEAVAATFSWEALGVYTAWFALQAVLHVVVPGRVLEGVTLRDGSKLKYKVNGWNCLLVTHVIVYALHVLGAFPITWVYDHFAELAVASILFSTALSFYLYVRSFTTRRAMLAEGGNSGIALYDFFIGRELNPRVRTGAPGTLDLKYFCELRPGLFLWHLINVACVVKQYQQTGSVSVALAIVAASQALYVADSVYNEECILTTMDIIMDGFGFMLAFGDLAWVPAMYSLQARFLTDFPQTLSPAYAALCVAVCGAGFYIFRAANAQKDAWKRDPAAPQFAGMAFVPTHTGSKLLAGGWWGVSRHVNYFGDWLLALGMCLPTGGVTFATYFYPVYFAVLLIHRELRDEHKCAAKYGPAWTEYCRLVPFRIVPGLY